MLNVTIPGKDIFLEESGTFYSIKETKLQLEHSLLSVKKWEQKWHKAFLKKDEKTDEELLDYIRCMTLTTNVDPMVYLAIPPSIAEEIITYINDPMSATVINTENENAPIKKKDVLTAELIYYWMITLNIPVEFQKWHLNQLITLINVIGIKNGNQGQPRKMSAAEARAAAAQRNKINQMRRAKYHTKG